MLLVPPADKLLNQPLLAVQLEISMLFQQDLARVPETLPTPVLPEDLIIQNAVQ